MWDMPYLDEVICADCIDVLKNIPTDSVDAVISSPPYYNQRVYGSKNNTVGSEHSLEVYLDNLESVFSECMRIVKPTGNIVFNLGDKYENDSLLLVPFRFAIRMTERTGAKLVNMITWIKPNPQPRQFKRRLVQSTEPFLHFVKSRDYKYFSERFMQKNIVKHNNGSRSDSKIGQSYFDAISSSKELTEQEKMKALAELKQVIKEVREGKISSFRMKIRGIHSAAYGGYEGGRKYHIENKGFTIIRMKGEPLKKDVIECPILNLRYVGHPAVYPEYIIQELLNLLTEKDDIVVDPFLGSGTTAVVARRMGRHYIGIENNEEYCRKANERIKRSAFQPSMELWMENKMDVR